ncbi:MAG: hypothetical protein IPM24_00360 [Bryobacterales bacterium]|nr:hypothetical protein [Bryobacterales bacterium]
MTQEERVYQRIGEFAVSFQWIENKLREIGWLIMDPSRSNWPPIGLRSLTNERLIDRVHELFVDALPKCNLPDELEADFKNSFASTVTVLHQLRRDRNRILHSAFIELKAGGEVQGLLRSNPKFQVEEAGEPLFDQELLTPESFSKEMTLMGDVALFLNRAYLQLIARYPDGGRCIANG